MQPIQLELSLSPAGCLLLAAHPSLAKDFLDQSRNLPGRAQSTTEHFSFILERDGPYPHYKPGVKLTEATLPARHSQDAGETV